MSKDTGHNAFTAAYREFGNPVQDFSSKSGKQHLLEEEKRLPEAAHQVVQVASLISQNTSVAMPVSDHPAMAAAENANIPGAETNNSSLLVLYGTETGHSQEVAEEITDCAERLRIQTCLEQMNDVSLVSKEKCLPRTQ